VVPPEFPEKGTQKAVTGNPYSPTEISGNPLKGDNATISLCAFTDRALSEKIFAANSLSTRLPIKIITHLQICQLKNRYSTDILD